jgi:predicted flap endonuclease-1-like 5' DNA nuclease
VIYVLLHIFAWLLIAALIGAAVGWLLRHFGLRRQIDGLHGQLHEVQEEREKIAGLVNEAAAAANEWKARCADLEADHGQLRADHEALFAKATAWDVERARLAVELQGCEEARTALHKQILGATERARIWERERTSLHGQLSDLIHKVQALEMERNRLQDDLRKAAAQEAAQGVRHEQALQRLRVEVAAQKAQLDAAEAAAREAEARRAAVESQLASVQAEQAEVRRRNEQERTTGDIERIEGIGPANGQKLRAIGIAWVRDLLAEGMVPGGRERIAAKTGIDRRLIIKWVNAADLLRLDGVTLDHAELLERSGVDTVKELRHRVAKNLHHKMVETNEKARCAPEVPPVEVIQGWIDQARALEPKGSH